MKDAKYTTYKSHIAGKLLCLIGTLSTSVVGISLFEQEWTLSFFTKLGLLILITF